MRDKRKRFLKLRELEDQRWEYVLAMRYFVSSLGYDASKMWEIDIAKNLIGEILDGNKDEKLASLSLAIETLKQGLLLDHQGLVFDFIKHRIKRAVGILGLDDLQVYGTLGLMVAIDRFDVKLGYQFSTFAAPWIKTKIYRAIARYGSTVRGPVLKGLIPVVSMEESDGSNMALKDRLAIKVDEDTSHHSGISEERVLEVFNGLSSIHQLILRGRFFDNRTLRDIGKEMGISRERVRQLQTVALQDMRCALQGEVEG